MLNPQLDPKLTVGRDAFARSQRLLHLGEPLGRILQGRATRAQGLLCTDKARHGAMAPQGSDLPQRCGGAKSSAPCFREGQNDFMRFHARGPACQPGRTVVISVSDGRLKRHRAEAGSGAGPQVLEANLVARPRVRSRGVETASAPVTLVVLMHVEDSRRPMARRGVAVDIARRDDDEEGPPGPRKRPRKDGAAPACDSPLPQRTATVESTQVTPGFTTSWRPFAARRGVEPPPRRGRRNWQKKKLGCFAEPTLKSGASTQPNQTAVGRGKRGGVVLAGKAEGHALPACRVKRAIMNDGRRDLVRRSQSQAGAALQLRHGRTRDTRWRIHDTGNMEQTCRPPDVSSWQSVSSRSGAGRAVHGLRARPRPRWAQAGPSGGSLWSSVGSSLSNNRPRVDAVAFGSAPPPPQDQARGAPSYTSYGDRNPTSQQAASISAPAAIATAFLFAMAPTSSELAKRYYCNGYGYCYNSRWYDWGRWVVVGAIIFFCLLILLSCTCVARRRRRRGAQPMYGTGWMAPAGKYGQNGHEMNNYQTGYNQQGYDQQQYQQGWNQQAGYANPPPAYGQQHPQYTGTTFNPNDGYYGQQQGQQYGVQQPAHTYQREGNFSPPPGPPPGK
ncbi:hypothetical protein PCL_07655 [Purpureocillium lilacinum]|uniref:Chitin synthesis regulation, Congo red resistance, RCR protein n=1 Tax=Purpureocillium lilacinum TaxID=33203 RepID=A0A2U3EIK8_PURLI|nr:hypothetical protein PCL_07655 [Purpureocillium lilacinum]